MSKLSRGLSVLALLGAYAGFRKYLLHWGASPAERRYQTASVVPVSTRAITIQATPAHVFAWLKQIGYQRGGFYSYQRLERFLGLPIVNAEQLEPQWQTLSEGDTLGIMPQLEARVETLAADHRLGLVFDLRSLRFHWHFCVFPIGQQTRLMVQTSAIGPVWAQKIWRYLGEPLHAVMEIGLLKGVKQRAER